MIELAIGWVVRSFCPLPVRNTWEHFDMPNWVWEGMDLSLFGLIIAAVVLLLWKYSANAVTAARSSRN